MNDTSYRSRMQRKLTDALAPTLLEIHDDSASHAGHTGHDARGESHFSIKIVSAAFVGRNRIARHREIYRLLADELKTRIHALSLETLTPDEHADGP